MTTTEMLWIILAYLFCIVGFFFFYNSYRENVRDRFEDPEDAEYDDILIDGSVLRMAFCVIMVIGLTVVLIMNHF